MADLLSAATRQLDEAGLPSPRVDAELLAAEVFDIPRGRLALTDQVPADRAQAYTAAVARRSRREPLQHITGTAYFRRLTLAVGPGVFVPRPETELLVDWLLDALAGRQRPRVVDLGTGSGALALAVATELPTAEVHAVEADATALAWARRNQEAIGCTVALHHADMATWTPSWAGTADAVVANPPYVPAATEVDAETAHDPVAAVYAEGAGLAGVALVAAAAARLLRPGGVLACEHDASQGESAPALLRDLGGWTSIIDHRDLAGRPRYVTASTDVGGRTIW
ncbi:MAG: peptide chain release factor N(5)-glutamine methyltransferase [Streptosporangiales bacterium]|nr:peptide chain release factor N(5)-glutamine methyltransferase [Streptosporangiales bacterium]